MNEIDDPLWIKIRDFHFDKENDELTYARKLAFEQCWKYEFTQKVIREYKKFLYLCAISDEPMSPSPIVDEAWHMHLSYTKSYWEDLCKGIMGKLLHHEPSRGGEAQTQYYDNLYLNTLSFYTKIFGTTPPADIWPPSMQEYRDSKKLTLKNYVKNARSDKYIVVKLLSVVVLIAIIAFFSYLLVNRPAVEE